MAGLRCAVELQGAGVEVCLLEAGDGVGGRVRTDELEGFKLDRGFQVLLTAYSELPGAFDLEALDLRAFKPGALVRREGRFRRITDPFREPSAVVSALLRGLGSTADKLRVAALRHSCLRGTVDELFARPEATALEALRARGFGAELIDGFFRPFLGGILLDRDLGSSSRMFEFVFRMLSVGDAAVPAAGMGALSGQLAARLTEGSLRLNARVRAVERGVVILDDGERIEADAVVVATDGPSAAQLLGEVADPGSRAVTCVYFDAPQSPVGEPLLVLGGDAGALVNNFAVLSDVAPSYAPPGRHLLAATVLGAHDQAAIVAPVVDELRQWYGESVDGWRHLRTYCIRHAQPAQPPGRLQPLDRPARTAGGAFVAGDHRTHASIEGALRSGRRVAEAVLAELGAPVGPRP
ncbi:protoporphyrinogen oxidase [Planctomycetes bacterium Pla86]|uniref:Protoporphyrinogen oxidase n=1 Tax=Engelhardtia mirabilis TaxID=2528011 RepID=A0A518BF58_9BACT|nr:protoporphyrinogen oxidase [Planctomycetes bacterium Pla133]QDU99945.1 protoporphyrinogen oxidase [Planctomycetes bacterium Pla86]